jgi:hypothetical protein
MRHFRGVKLWIDEIAIHGSAKSQSMSSLTQSFVRMGVNLFSRRIAREEKYEGIKGWVLGELIKSGL